ncbi:MAG: hypothetical protein RL217_244 [Pseudomonadota bacterium]|jgi:thiamine transporter ThiT
MDIVFEIANYVRPYSLQIAFALVATTLILSAGAINGAVRNLMKSWNVVLRVLVFILLCAVGYGVLASWLTHFLQGYLRGLAGDMFVLQVSLAFIVLGIVAERKQWK